MAAEDSPTLRRGVTPCHARGYSISLGLGVPSHFVPLRIDFSDDGPGTEDRRTAYGVTALPAVLICSPGACAGVATRSVGYIGPAEMLAFLGTRTTPQ